MNKKEILILVGIAVVFVALHLPGLNNLYHQDEYKWPMIVNPAITEPGGIPHPPVGEFIYRQAGFLVGYDNFRLVPFFFGFLNLFLLFYLVKNLYGTKAALWSAGLFTISFFSLLASLMIDTDGAIMPFFFLILSISYFELKKRNFQFKIFNFQDSKWLGLMIFGAIGGFFVKASFVIGIGALALDFAFEKNVFEDRKKILKYLLFSLGGIITLGLLLLLAKLIFPFFNLESSLKYWEHFAKISGRGWFQTFIQFAKAIMYTSPLLILPTFFVDREMFKKLRPFFLFIFFGLFFYLVAFDFSTGALDRYFQFLVVPLCVISGAVLSLYFSKSNNSPYSLSRSPSLIAREGTALGVIAVIIFYLQFVPHFAPPLYPKTEWIQKFLSLEWNFLFPFTGGSGPTGFYVSFLFISVIWICGIISLVSGFFSKGIKEKALLLILVTGILYNIFFIEEYLFGKINGNSQILFEGAKKFIAENTDIKKVVVYNDIGGYEIQKLGKYERRLYATPQFEGTYRDFFKDFSGHVLYIDIPRMGENNFYSNYLLKCKEIYTDKDKYISAKIFECKK